MNRLFKTILFAGASLAAFGLNAQTADGFLEHKILFETDTTQKFWRIPAMCKLANGDILAGCDLRWGTMKDLPGNIDVVTRISHDNGHTWDPITTVVGQDCDLGYGDPAFVLNQKNGDVIILCTHDRGLWDATPERTQRIIVIHSHDNGKTWDKPLDITDQLYGINCKDPERSKWLCGFASSGRALQLKDGRIMFVLVTRNMQKENDRSDYRTARGWLQTYAVYSDDGGYNWSVSKVPGDYDGDESKVVELNNGDVLMSVRNCHKGPRKYSISHDRGETWSTPEIWPDLIEPACNGDIIRYRHGDKDILLHSVPNDPQERRNVTVFASFDEGKTWPVKRTICAGNSVYSTLEVLDDGTICCLYEGWGNYGKIQIEFVRFTIDWLLQ
mgnify:FL=1